MVAHTGVVAHNGVVGRGHGAVGRSRYPLWTPPGVDWERHCNPTIPPVLFSGVETVPAVFRARLALRGYLRGSGQRVCCQ